MIHAIKLTRFKQFRETEVKLQPFSILMGENNSGKTTILQALWLALSGLHQGRLISIDRKTLQTKISSTGFPMYEIPFVPQGDFSGLFYKRISREGQTYDENSGALLEIVDEQQNHYRLHLRELFRCLNFKLLTPAQEIHHPTIQNYAPLYISGFSGLYFQEERMFPAILEAKMAAGHMNAAIRNIVLDLKLHVPEKYHYLETLLDEGFGFHMKEVEFRENEERYIFAEYEEREKLDAVGLEFGSSGSGMMQILQILAVILRYCPEKTKVVLIDEPEMHLQESLQVKLAEILRQVQEKLGIQIILSTHSQAMICDARPEEVIPILPYAPVNKILKSSTKWCGLSAYEAGRAKISGKLVYMETAVMSLLKDKARELHIKSLNGMHAVPVIRGWRADDTDPFLAGDVLKQMTGRSVQIYVICMAERRKESEKEQLLMQAAESGVNFRMIAEQDSDEKIQEILNELQADVKIYRAEDETQPEQKVRKREYEQLTLLDLS